MKKLSLLLIPFLVAACGSKPRSKDDRERNGKGLVEGNGGSGPSFRSNPWFLGAQPVSYCIRRGVDFSVGDDQLRTLVAEVLQSWTSVVDQLIDEDEKPSLAAKGIEYSKSYQLADSCQDGTDLVFAFGSPDGHLSQVIKYSSKNLVGFSSLVEYDIKALRGRGEVYIAPDSGESAYRAKDLQPGFWADHDKLFDVLLHEVGHVMGFDHDRTSFMFEYFPGYRLVTERKGRLSASMLLARHMVTAGSFNLCGTPWYDNGDKQFVSELSTAKKICFKSAPFDTAIIVEATAGGNPASYPIVNIDSGGGSNVSRLFTESEELLLGTYADDYAWHGTLKRNNVDIPMSISLETEGFVLKLYDLEKKSWSEVVTLSDDLRLFNEAGQ